MVVVVVGVHALLGSCVGICNVRLLWGDLLTLSSIAEQLSRYGGLASIIFIAFTSAFNSEIPSHLELRKIQRLCQRVLSKEEAFHSLYIDSNGLQGSFVLWKL